MRVNDELETFESLIKNLAINRMIDPAGFDDAWVQLPAETERVKRAFVREAFGLIKEKKVERYIQYHQAALVHLIDSVVSIVSPEDIHAIDSASDTERLLKFIYRQLEDLLIYIEKHFAKYFNQAAKTPESYRFIVHRELRLKVPEVRYTLERKGINKRLLSIILSPLDTFIELVTEAEISFKKVIYLRQLLSELEELANNRLTGTRLDFKVCLSMAYLNYNSQRFFKYCTHEITRMVQEQQTLSGQIEKLSFMMKIVNQVQVKPSFVLDDRSGSIRDQLSVWIGEEIFFFEKRQQLSLNFPANAEDPAQREFKLRFNMSVAQLACFLRGLKDTGVIKNNNIFEMLRFFASVAQTKNTDSISWESLRAKFYQIEHATREGVLDMSATLQDYFKKN